MKIHLNVLFLRNINLINISTKLVFISTLLFNCSTIIAQSDSNNINSDIIIDQTHHKIPARLEFDVPVNFIYINKNNPPIDYIGLAELDKNFCYKIVKNKECNCQRFDSIAGYKNIVSSLKKDKDFKFTICGKQNVFEQKTYHLIESIYINKFYKIDTLGYRYYKLINPKEIQTINIILDTIKHLKKAILKGTKCEQGGISSIYQNNSLIYQDSVRFNIGYLRPNKRYQLILGGIKKPDFIDSVFNLMCEDSTMEEARCLYNARTRGSIYTNKDCLKCGTDNFDPVGFDVIKMQFDLIKGKELYYNMNKCKSDYEKEIATVLKLENIGFNRDSLAISLLKEVYDNIQYLKCCKEKNIDYCNLEKKHCIFFVGASIFNEQMDSLLSYGYKNVLNKDKKLPAYLEFKLRKENLDTLLFVINQTLEVINNFIVGHPDYYIAAKNMNKYLKSKCGAIKANQESLISMDDRINSFKMKYNNSQTVIDTLLYRKLFMTPYSQLGLNTFTYNFATRADYNMLADVGIMYYNNFNINSKVSGGSLYFGIHFNFRPINTNIDWKEIRNKRFLDYFSFNTGVLIGSFESEGEHTGLIGKTAFFTGLGYAFNEWLRLTGGTVLYRRFSENPLVDNLSLAVVPYVGLSADIRLKSIYETVKNAIAN